MASIHNPMIFTLGILGNLVSFMVYLAPAPTFYKIFKKKSTQGFQCVPYVVALLSSMMWIYYATLKSNEILLITINSIGCFIEAFYIAIYITYAPKKVRMLTLKLLVLLNFCGVGLIIILTHILVKGSKRVHIVGWITVSLSASVFIAPLSIMKHVICTKSVEFMPISLSFALLSSAVIWFFYGLLLKDIYIAVPNIVGLIFGVVQIILYVTYRGCNEEAEKELPTTVLKPKTFEIYPVCPLPIQDDQNAEMHNITIEEIVGVTIEPEEKMNTSNGNKST